MENLPFIITLLLFGALCEFVRRRTTGDTGWPSLIAWYAPTHAAVGKKLAEANILPEEYLEK